MLKLTYADVCLHSLPQLELLCIAHCTEVSEEGIEVPPEFTCFTSTKVLILLALLRAVGLLHKLLRMIDEVRYTQLYRVLRLC